MYEHITNKAPGQRSTPTTNSGELPRSVNNSIEHNNLIVNLFSRGENTKRTKRIIQ